jgi:hypothetical protein
VNTTAQVGGALGLAVLATLSTTRTNDLLAAGKSTASALTSGYHLAFVIGAALVLAAIAVAFVVLEQERRQLSPEEQELVEAEAGAAYSEAA